MRVRYKRKDGSLLECYYWGYGQLEISLYKSWDMEHLNPRVEVDFNDPNSKFEYDNEVFRFWDFEALNPDELVQKLNDEYLSETAKGGYRAWISEDVALCTLLKYPNGLGVLMQSETMQRIPMLSIGIKGSGSDIIEAMFVPYEGRYNKDNWHYKISLKPVLSEVLEMTGSCDMYFSDFWSSVCQKHYELVDLQEFNEKNPNYKYSIVGKV